MVRLAIPILLTVALGLPSTASAGASFERATEPREWTFPRDHGSHPNFATEWWYFTGSLFDTNDHRYGYELTFFRVGLRADFPDTTTSSAWRARDLIVAHLTITEVEWERFHQGEMMQRAAMDLAGAHTDSLNVWVDDWRAQWRTDGSVSIKARQDDFGVDLTLRPTREPILHGDSGLSWKDGSKTEASYYATQPRMQTSGAITLGGLRRAVSGSTWMDHEFFSGATPREGMGWDWFSVRLSDGRDLMLYRVRRDGEAATIFGTVIEAEGNYRPMDTTDLRMIEQEWWTSKRTGSRYPIAWEIELPAESLHIEVRPTLAEQEVDARRTVGFPYWEGLCDFDLEWDGASLQGEGYVELTGYGRSRGSQP
jgi:predicted secreted hydrolase